MGLDTFTLANIGETVSAVILVTIVAVAVIRGLAVRLAG